MAARAAATAVPEGASGQQVAQLIAQKEAALTAMFERRPPPKVGTGVWVESIHSFHTVDDAALGELPKEAGPHLLPPSGRRAAAQAMGTFLHLPSAARAALLPAPMLGRHPKPQTTPPQHTRPARWR